MANQICEYCNKIHDGSFGSGRFCSRSCANSRGPRSNETKEKQRRWAKANPRGWAKNPGKFNKELNAKKKIERIESICQCCGGLFEQKINNIARKM